MDEVIMKINEELNIIQIVLKRDLSDKGREGVLYEQKKLEDCLKILKS